MAAMRSLLLLALAATAAAEKRSPVEFVLARGENTEDSELQWVHPHAKEARVTLYSKGRKAAKDMPEDVHQVELPNVGQEGHSYLTHIVKNYDSLAEKTVFMPAAKPIEGFNGFQRGAASLMPGVRVPDYARADAAPLFVPTMAISPDLKQTSVRMAFMENTPEHDVPKGRNFTACAAGGKDGWSPMLPNKFGSSVLEPLMKAQTPEGAEPAGLAAFWSKHLPETPMPSAVMFAHGSVLSVARDQILAHPRAFYEGLIDELNKNKNPFEAYYLEYMWWYIFNHKGASLCPGDHGAAAAAAPAARGRKLVYDDSISVLEPKVGITVKYGDFVPISWAEGSNYGPKQIELFRYGNYETVLATMVTGSSWNWVVVPGPSDSAAHAAGTNGKPAENNLRADINRWYEHYILKPNDKYTIRVCPMSLLNAGSDYHCDTDPFGESGEFNIKASVDVNMPPSGFTHTVNNELSATNTKPFLPIAWTSYYTTDSKMTMSLINAATGYTVATHGLTDTGYYNLYLSPDTPTGQYIVEITAKCEADCKNQFMGPNKQSGTTASGRSGVFTIIAAASPPPSPSAPPAASPAPNAPFELPIIKAFRGQFGTEEVQTVSGAYHDYSTTSTTSGGNNCEYVCRVYRTVRTGRRLLFGGLQYSGGSPQVVGCTPAQIACGCCTRG